MDRLLKCIRPAAFWSRDFFLLHDNGPAQKSCKFLSIFDPKKCYNPLSPPSSYCPDLSIPDYFLFHKLKLKLKGLHFTDVAEIQEAVTDELKKIQKDEFSAGFHKLYDRARGCIYTNGAYFYLKNVRVFLVCLRFKKKSVLKLLDRTVYER
jgi:hypothetical protein